MASEEHPPVYPDDDLDDDDEDSEPLNDAVAGDSDSSSETDDCDANSTATASVTLAIPAPTPTPSVSVPDPKPPPPSIPPPPAPEKKPIDDSRRLFQRLWTDEDEIELLQGFLEYTSSRGTSGHHHDTTAFYDQIKSKLQLDFNKNQLVEKLRRLKKKFRNVLGKMSSGKEFVFKSPHDQATFEISRKIWSNTPVGHRGAVEFDDDDQNPSPNNNPNNPNATPNNNSSYGINLNNSATADHRAGNSNSFDVVGGGASNLSAHAIIAGSKLSSRKRPRVAKLEDRYVRVNLGGTGTSEGANNVHTNNNNNSNNINNNNNSSNVGVGSAMQGLIEETVKNCLVPVFKDLMNNAAVNVNGASHNKGVGALAMNAIPLNFSGVNMVTNGEAMNEKWRKQQILELEVYSKRLELVQDQIKSTLEELRSMGT